MPGFSKLYSTIVTSSIWSEPPEICKVWITLLALSDAEGFVSASLPGLADMCRIDMMHVGKIVKVLEGPDPFSRTPDNEGRRIRAVGGGWLILNYRLYRDGTSFEPQKLATRERVRRFRDKKRLLRGVTMLLQERYPASASAFASASEQFRKSYEDWIAHLDQKHKPPTEKAVEQQLARCLEWGDSRAIAAIRYSIEHNWQGIFEEKPEYKQRLQGNNGEKPLSTWEIEQRLKAIQGELDKASISPPAGWPEREAKLCAERKRLKLLKTGVA